VKDAYADVVSADAGRQITALTSRKKITAADVIMMATFWVIGSECRLAIFANCGSVVSNALDVG